MCVCVCVSVCVWPALTLSVLERSSASSACLSSSSISFSWCWSSSLFFRFCFSNCSTLSLASLSTASFYEGQRRGEGREEEEGGDGGDRGRGGEENGGVGGEGWESGAGRVYVKLLQCALKCIQGTKDSGSVLAKSAPFHIHTTHIAPHPMPYPDPARPHHLLHFLVQCGDLIRSLRRQLKPRGRHRDARPLLNSLVPHLLLTISSSALLHRAEVTQHRVDPLLSLFNGQNLCAVVQGGVLYMCTGGGV